MDIFFGRMPADEIEIERTFVDRTGLKATIQAGKKGYTVLWDDGSYNYADVEDTAHNNYLKALDTYLSCVSGKVYNIFCGKECCEEIPEDDIEY